MADVNTIVIGVQMSEVEKATEKIAKRMAKEQTGSDALWEMFLTEAYREYYKLNEKDQRQKK